MKHALKVFSCLIAILFATFAHAKTSTDLSILDDETRSMIMKERMRTQGLNSNSNQSAASDSKDPLSLKNTILIDGGISSGCDINIGNSKSKPGSNTKPTTVIITGPVIQMPGKGCN
jgi:hypothetical protein